MMGIRLIITAGLVLVLSLASYNRSALYQDKITLWTDVVTKSPNNARAHNNLGQALVAQDRREDAIRQFLFALQLNPIYDNAHYNIGTLLSESGQLDDALMHFRMALQLNPGNADYHNNIAIVLYKKGQIDEAIVHVRRALEIEPKHELASLGLRMLIGKER